MRLKGLTAALIGLSVLCLAGCGSTRQASERVRAESSELRESRDSLREEISQNLNENLAEHEVVTETVIYNDALKIERITDRVRTLESGSRFKAQRSKVEVRMVRDTVYVERVDTIEVQKLQGTSSSLNPHPSALNYLKWICWILIGLIGLIITVKVCLRLR
jgi:hypothetical protein